MEFLISVRDQNLNIPFDGVSVRGKRGASIGNKEGGRLGGRKALRDVSNSVLPTPIHSSTGQTSNISFNGKLSSAFETHDPSKKKGVSRVSKKAQTGARKALSDISNLDEPRLDEAPKNNLNALRGGEGFLHNHEHCIRKRDMNVNDFLMTLGLDDDSTTNKPAKMKLFSPHKSLEVEEMADLLFEEFPSPPRHHQSLKVESPLPSPKFFNQECVSFKLTETPKLLKP